MQPPGHWGKCGSPMNWGLPSASLQGAVASGAAGLRATSAGVLSSLPNMPYSCHRMEFGLWHLDARPRGSRTFIWSEKSQKGRVAPAVHMCLCKGTPIAVGNKSGTYRLGLGWKLSPAARRRAGRAIAAVRAKRVLASSSEELKKLL